MLAVVVWLPCNCCHAVLALTISATPLPMSVKAGKSIAHHQPRPPGLNKMAKATSIKPRPMKVLVIPCPRFGGLLPRRRLRRPRESRSSGNWPVSAAGTSDRLAPHVRQNFVPSAFCDPQFGQYIIFNLVLFPKHKRKREALQSALDLSAGRAALPRLNLCAVSPQVKFDFHQLPEGN